MRFYTKQRDFPILDQDFDALDMCEELCMAANAANAMSSYGLI